MRMGTIEIFDPQRYGRMSSTVPVTHTPACPCAALSTLASGERPATVKVAPGSRSRIKGSTSERKYSTASTLGSESIDPQKTMSDIGEAAPRGAKYSTSTPVETLVTVRFQTCPSFSKVDIRN